MTDSSPGPSRVEHLKAGSDHLRGTIGPELADPGPAFSGDAAQLLKFHGVYQQDDRDVRADRTRRGLGVDHICMVRVSVPGGVMTADQYLALDSLAEVGSGTLRITTRQGLQYHFVRKGDLRSLIAEVDHQLLTTFGACGDVVRNTMCCPAPLADRAATAVQDHAAAVARRFRPRSSAYAEVWLDGERVAALGPPRPGTIVLDDGGEDPLYGPTYLPRKFKIGFAFPGDNCVDVYTQDVGVVPVVEGGRLRAFTILVGGGLGRSHNRPDTFPRLADPLATVPPDALMDVIAAVVAVQRDHGDRADREHARLKYLVEEWGVERFRAEVERHLGGPLARPHPVVFHESADHLGWHPQGGGRWFLGVKVENGRVADTDRAMLRSGVRAVVTRFGPGVRLTPREDLLLTDVAGADRAGVDALLAGYGIRPVEDWSAIGRHAFACPALPTCGLALAESERALPGVLAELADELAALGLGGLDVHVRMTGCPNGCARPYTAEIGFVGRAKHRYDVHLGGEPVGTRLNDRFAENVPRAELVGVLRPVLVEYRDRRHPAEGFGDWCRRSGVADLRARLGTEQWVRARPAPGGTPAGAGPAVVGAAPPAPRRGPRP